MSGSVAEERIRAKTEALLRQRYPSARIIHELVLEQGGVRLDLAAVTEDRLIVAEIKSERDVLKRLRSQVERAVLVAQTVWIVVAPKHRAALEAAHEGRLTIALPEPIKDKRGWTTTHRYEPNPAYVPSLRRCWRYVEGPEGLDGSVGWDWGAPREEPSLNPRSMLELLWADELRWLAQQGSRATREEMIRIATEHLTGRQVRQGVCAALRARRFPRADEAVASTKRAA